ncbi:MAG TPA: RidA family protein [Pyrinomonadaceae bacterium]|nr:RidA family protein [Pyrinomonadaceae bacterium]
MSLFLRGNISYNPLMMIRFLSTVILFLTVGWCCCYAQERKVIIPANAAKPVGPYSPGIFAGNYLYVSGQGVRDANGTMPSGIEAQTRQCLDNVKAIIEAAGLTMEHVVHTQLYLEKMGDFAAVDRVYATYFPQTPPARIIVGVAKMPTDTTVEITIVAVRDLQLKKVLSLTNLKPMGHASSAVVVGDRVYLSGVYGETQSASNRNLQRALNEAKLHAAQIVFRNEYSTNTPSMIPVNELPGNARATVSVVAVRGALGKSGVRKSSDVCAAADGGTIFCSVQTGTASGGSSVAGQVRTAMNNLQAGLEKHGARLSHVTASNVYLDDIREFKQMNETYASFFSNAPPTRTTVQPFAPVADRSRNNPALVRISVVAVK